jgi:hypothetical protein
LFFWSGYNFGIKAPLMHTNHIRTARAIKLAILLVVSIGGLIMLGSAVSASGLINAVIPEGVDSTPVIVPPPLVPPPGAASYAPHRDLTEAITAPDRRPIAQLANPNVELIQSINVYAPETVGPEEQVAKEHDVYFEVLASVEYRVDGHVFVISTARPSPKAAQQPTAFGDQEIQLPNGITAWITTQQAGAMSNRVVFLKDDLIITLVGDLPLERLKILALQVVIP